MPTRVRAVPCRAMPSCVELCRAVLSHAVPSGAVLSRTRVLPCRAELSGAVLRPTVQLGMR